MKKSIKKVIMSFVVVLGAFVSAGAFAHKVIIVRGCDKYGCEFTKRMVGYNYGKKVVDQVHCRNATAQLSRKK